MSIAVKPGYKQTEVGVIPKDWEVKTLGKFVSLQRGHDLTEQDRKQGNIPVMGSAGQNGFHDTAIVKGPGIVIGRSGASFGQAHYCEVDFWPHNTALYVTDLNGNDPLYAFYFLRALDFTRYNSGGAQQSLNRNFISPIPIGVPPTAEQRAIAEALSDVDALIESLEQLLGKKRQVKQGAMQKLLTGKKRLPGFNGEWEEKKLGDIAEIQKGELITEQRAVPGRIPVIAGGKKPSYFHNLANRRGKTITISGSGASAGYVALYGIPIFASDCSTIGEGERYSVEFIYFVLLLNQSAIYKAQTGGAQPHIHPSDLRPLSIAFPKTKAEQTAIAAVLSDMDAGIETLETKLAKSRQIKQGMMQELLTGKTRLMKKVNTEVNNAKP